MLPLYFSDQRRFGNFKVVDTVEATAKLGRLGWDAIEDPRGSVTSSLLTKHGKKAIADVLLMQDVFAGVGNYVRAEALYRARIHPDRLVGNVSAAELTALCAAVSAVLNESYKVGGATLKTFYTDGERGGFSNQLRVYGRHADPEGNLTDRKKDRKGRTVWFVPDIQT